MAIWRGKPYLAILEDKEEDRFTRYLSELLQSDELLPQFLSRICKAPYSGDHSTLSVQTQVIIEGGRPDLVVEAPDVLALFEAKVSSWLHENQAIPYLKKLGGWLAATPNGRAFLFLLGPAYSSTHLAAEARSQQVALSQDPESRGTVSQVRLEAIAWEDIAAFCADAATAVADKELAVHLRAFHALVSRRLGDAERPYTREEVLLLEDPLVARAIVRSRNVLDKTKDELTKDASRGFSASSSKSTGAVAYEGYNIKYAGRSWWLGLWPHVWAQLGQSPLFLQLPGFANRRLPEIPEPLPQPQEYHETGGHGYALPLLLGHDMDLATIAREHARIVQLFCATLPESGLPTK